MDALISNETIKLDKVILSTTSLINSSINQLKAHAAEQRSFALSIDPIKISEIIELCQFLTAEYDQSHDIYHHVNVLINSLNILKELQLLWNVDYDESASNRIIYLIIYSSMLHDTIDHKYPDNLEGKKKILDQFLKLKMGSDAANIRWIIDNMSYSKEVKLGYPENGNKLLLLIRDIVSDGDKLEALGKVGLERCKQFTQTMNPTKTESEINQLIIEHCNEKLLKLKDQFIRTSPGKRMAGPLHEEIVQSIFE